MSEWQRLATETAANALSDIAKNLGNTSQVFQEMDQMLAQKFNF